jgi:hypothetical protein
MNIPGAKRRVWSFLDTGSPDSSLLEDIQSLITQVQILKKVSSVVVPGFFPCSRHRASEDFQVRTGGYFLEFINW